MVGITRWLQVKRLSTAKKGGPRFDYRPGTLGGKISLSYSDEVKRRDTSSAEQKNIFVELKFLHDIKE